MRRRCLSCDADRRQGTLLQGPSPPAGAGALHLSDGAVPESDGGRTEGPTGPVRDPRILTGGADGKDRGKISREALIKTKSHILPGINMQNIYGQKYPALPADVGSLKSKDLQMLRV